MRTGEAEEGLRYINRKRIKPMSLPIKLEKKPLDTFPRRLRICQPALSLPIGAGPVNEH
jgi:hypothetical protein